MELIVLKKEDIAREIAKEIVTLINRKNNACLGLATGSSPIGVYQELIKAYNNKFVSFKNVKTYNLDEYIGLKEDDSQSYHYFMNKNLFEHIDINKENIHIPDGLNSSKCIGTYEQEIAKDGGIDFQILGIGSNGHIAFNDPPADLDCTDCYKVVDLNERCKKQQVGEGWFPDTDHVPTQAISMTVQQILKCKHILSAVPGERKAEAIYNTLTQTPNDQIPATMLKTHGDWTLYLDSGSASKIIPY